MIKDNKINIFDMGKLKIEFETYLKTNKIDAKSFHPYYEKALNEMVLAGGKRFRPMLLLTVVNSIKPKQIKDAFKIAQAIELMHTYSLIHDDLPMLDNADLRRNYPTLHKTFDEVTALLVGDALNTHSFNLIATSNFNDTIKIKLVEELSKNAGADAMALGQAIDCHYDFNNLSLNLEQIKFLHENKTGKIIAGSLKIGAIISDLNNKKLQDQLYNFGLKLGLLFQIQDDIFDITKSEKETQKTTNLDKNKNTFVTHLGIKGSIKECDKLTKELEQGLKQFDKNLQTNLKILLDKYIYRHRD